jgi:hypothetical protein
MDSRFKPTIQSEGSMESKRSYCDKAFKKNLAKTLRINQGEPENIETMRT